MTATATTMQRVVDGVEHELSLRRRLGAQSRKLLRDGGPQPDLMRLLGHDVCHRIIDQLGIVSITDLKGTIIYANDEFVRVSGYSREELIGQNHRLLNSGHHSHKFFHNMFRTIAHGRPWRAPIQNRAKDGSLYWVDCLILPLNDIDGVLSGYISVRLDITVAVGLHMALHERDKLLQAILDNFPGGIAVYDSAFKMLVCNQKQKELLEYPEHLFEGGLPTLEQLLRFNALRGEYGEGNVEDLVHARLELARQNVPHSYERRRPNGRHIEVLGAPLVDGGFISTHVDITERKRDQELIEKLALHDALTGLANRRLLRDRMQIALARVKRGDNLALLYLDLDRFKAVNDTLGHPVGDALLRAVSDRLRKETRATDTVARLGGDEFAILQIGLKSQSDAADLAQRIIREVSAPYQLGKHTITIGTSIGVALAPRDSTDADQLLTNADLALYHVKASGRGSHRFFQNEMNEKARARNAIESGLLVALEREELKLHYQPIVSTTDRSVTGFEALLRWYHPDRGLISAAEFIPVAEDTGLIEPIGNWVLKQACLEAKNWPSHISVSVNLSVAQLRNRDMWTTIANAAKVLDPSRLVLEITESMLMQNNQQTLDTFQRARESGIKIALDDFGTGYSSLGYLQKFPFDKIKIDRSFIASTASNARSKTLLSAIANLGRALNMTTLAEGVETEEQFECIKSQGCSEAQGFLISAAVPPAELGRFLTT